MGIVSAGVGFPVERNTERAEIAYPTMVLPHKISNRQQMHARMYVGLYCVVETAVMVIRRISIYVSYPAWICMCAETGELGARTSFFSFFFFFSLFTSKHSPPPSSEPAPPSFPCFSPDRTDLP